MSLLSLAVFVVRPAENETFMRWRVGLTLLVLAGFVLRKAVHHWRELQRLTRMRKDLDLYYFMLERGQRMPHLRREWDEWWAQHPLNDKKASEQC